MLLPRNRMFEMRLQHIVPIIVLLLMAVLILVIAGATAAAPALDPPPHYVDGASGIDSGDCTDPTKPCKTIGYALNKSFQSFGINDIYVAQGTYKENLIITDNVNLFGGFDPTDWTKRPMAYGSTIDGRNFGSVVRYVDGFAGKLEGFKITNGKAAQGGGIYVDLGSPELNNLWIVGNEATDSGGGIYSDGGQLTITSSRLEHNEATNFGGAIFITNNSTNTLSDLNIMKNEARSGGGLSIQNAGATLDGSDLVMNVATVQGGAVHMQFADLQTSDTVFAKNHAGDHGGAVFADGQSLEIVNGLFYGNSTTAGKASILAMSDTEVFVVNSTLAYNQPQGQQAIFRWGTNGIVLLKNSIMWNNSRHYQSDPPCPSCFIADWSDVQDYSGGTHNIEKDPLFRSPSGGNFQLQKQSPCINAGTASGGFPAPEYDIDGNPRDANPDMGAYEYVAPVYKFRAYLPVIMRK